MSFNINLMLSEKVRRLQAPASCGDGARAAWLQPEQAAEVRYVLRRWTEDWGARCGGKLEAYC